MFIMDVETLIAIKMKTVTELKQEKQDRYNNLIHEVGMFFAFSNEQFEKNKTPLKEGEKYVSLGAGGYMPKGNVTQWLSGCKEIEKWYKTQVKASKNEEQEILYELRNHECFYTGDWTEAVTALPNYTEEQIRVVYCKHCKKEREFVSK